MLNIAGTWKNVSCKRAATFHFQHFLLESHLQYDKGSNFKWFIFRLELECLSVHPGSVTYYSHDLGQVAICKREMGTDGLLILAANLLSHSLFNLWNTSSKPPLNLLMKWYDMWDLLQNNPGERWRKKVGVELKYNCPWILNCWSWVISPWQFILLFSL